MPPTHLSSPELVEALYQGWALSPDGPLPAAPHAQRRAPAPAPSGGTASPPAPVALRAVAADLRGAFATHAGGAGAGEFARPHPAPAPPSHPGAQALAAHSVVWLLQEDGTHVQAFVMPAAAAAAAELSQQLPPSAVPVLQPVQQQAGEQAYVLLAPQASASDGAGGLAPAAEHVAVVPGQGGSGWARAVSSLPPGVPRPYACFAREAEEEEEPREGGARRVITTGAPPPARGHAAG